MFLWVRDDLAMFYFTLFRSLSVSPVSERAKVEEKLGIPLPPPKPITPYLRWSLENRAKLAKNAPEKSFLGWF
jgi:hypothetical protein